jgi:hypothetical protein
MAEMDAEARRRAEDAERLRRAEEAERLRLEEVERLRLREAERMRLEAERLRSEEAERARARALREVQLRADAEAAAKAKVDECVVHSRSVLCARRVCWAFRRRWRRWSGDQTPSCRGRASKNSGASCGWLLCQSFMAHNTQRLRQVHQRDVQGGGTPSTTAD